MPDDKKKEILEQEKQLDENETEAVAGAGCVCYLGGGGGVECDWDKTCACIIGGGGEWSEHGMQEGKMTSKCRCDCFGYGDGV